ncbi:hypothetical protein ASF28_11410 [Methylobacterium sp. Leaf99]|uniref:Ig-like domain-containing protein n=1 Tax=Methylobacterium sp. Leaf99 TaxID=1736251 RepID=UPI0006F9D5AD|nr:Ig-like domain-containing protein [Methylobacterium sp. Leaf99]KQP07727.1 hypothetical protein ASF28_11410 [Methylobacterium sp. Leaf99]
MAGTLAPLVLGLSPFSDTGVPLDGLTRRNSVDISIVGLNLLGGPITIFDDRDGNGLVGSGEILTTIPAGLLGSSLGAVRVNLAEGTHNLRATQSSILGTATSLPLQVRIDNTGPTILAVSQLDTPDPLGLLDLLGVLRYEVTFSEPVLGLSADLFQATGTLPGIHLVTLLPSLTKPNTYIVSVGLGLDGVSLDQRAGTLGLALNPSNLSGVTDLAGNGLRGADFALLAPVSIGPARETATADFNGDGLGDAAFLVNDTVVVTRGTGTGSLGAAQTIAVAAGQTTIATGDVTGDGLVDIVTAGNGRVQILTQGTGGSFTLTNRTTPGTDGALIADVNGDGYADIVVKSLSGTSATVLVNNGTGTFTTGTTASLNVRPDALVSGDFNGDGRIDLAALANGGTSLSVLTQAANGTFVRSTLAVGAGAGGLAAGDLNGDGRSEIVSAGTAGTLEIRGSTAAGATIQTTLQAGAAATDIRIGDTNGDGKQDILYAGTDGNVRVVYGDGAGNFSAPVILETQAGLGALALLDINGDGRQDLALASGTTGTLQVGTGIPLAGVLGTAYDLVAPAPVQTVTAVRVAGDNIVNIAEAAAGTVPVTGTLSGPLGTGESLAVRIGGIVTPLAAAVVVTTNGVTTYAGTIPTLQASGDVAVLVQRTDGAASVALTQAVTVDLAAPTLVSVTSPDGAVTKDTVIDFTLTFSEPVSGLTAANLGLTGTAAAGLVPSVATTDGGRTYLVTVPAATAEGTLGLTFNPAGVRDAAGNLVPGAGIPAPVGPVLTLDRTAPVLTLQPIAGDGIVSQAEIAGGVVLAGTATGLEVGASVMVTVTNAAGTPVLTTTATVAGGNFSLPLTGNIGTLLTDGSYVVSVAAMDAAGNVAAPAVTNLTVDLTADAGAPVAIALGNGRPIGLAGVAAVPLAVTGLDAGATAIVTFTDAGNHVVTKTIAVNGNASVDLSTLNGAVTSSIQITDTVGNTATLPGPAALIDTVAPLGNGLLASGQAPGTVRFDVTFPEAVTGLDAGDFQVVGTGTVLGNVTQVVANQGGYTVVVGNLSGAGTLGLALSATSDIIDAAGNVATLGPITPVSLDLVPPPRPIITGLVSDGGVPGGFLTADTTPTLAGTAEAGSTVTVSYQGAAGATGTLTAVAGVSGAWTATVPGALADGSYAFTATAADASGNVSLPASTKIVTVETATGIPFTLAVDFGDGLVNGAEAAAVTYTLGGLPVGASLSVVFTDADGTTASASLTDQGGTLNLSGLDGPVTSALTYVPPVGQAVSLGGPGATFDTVAPLAPTILGFASAGNLPVTVTNDTTPILIGTGEAGSTVTVAVGGQSLSAVVDTGGTWRIPVTTPLTDGTVTLTALAQDAAGNSSTVRPGVPVTIDLQVDADDAIVVGLDLPPDRLLSAVEAAALTGTVSGIDTDATATLTFTGSGGTVTVPLVNGQLAPANLSGLSGAVTASVSVVDFAGNRATLPVGVFTVDATAPAATIVAAPAAAAATSTTYTVTFPEAVANLTIDDFALTRTGTAAGTLSTVTEVGGVYTVTVTGITGTGSLALGLAAGSNIADLAGNPAIVAQAGLHLVNIPVVVPPESLPVITGITEDTGVAGDFVTYDASPVVSGTALAGATLTLTYTGPTGIPVSQTTTVDGAGQWSVTLPVLGDGPYTLSATLTDGANTVLGVSPSRALVIDTAADAGAPIVLTVSGTADNLVNAAEARAVSYTVAGLDAGSTATAHFVAGGLVKDVPVAADGSFTVDLSGFNGVVTTSLIVSDLAGNAATIPGNSIQVATAVTAQPSVGAVVNDSGVDGDGITNDTSPILSGRAEAGSAVVVTVNGPAGPQTVQATSDLLGAWTVSVPTLAEGAYTVTASATGSSGLPSPASNPFALTIDTSADTAPLVAVQLASADTRLGAGEAGAVGFTLTGLDTGSSGAIAFTDGQAIVSVPVGTNGTYTANLSGLSGSITAEAILTDVAGNTVTADLSLPAGLTVDTLAPRGSAVADVAGGTTVASFTYAVTFPEAVANVTADDFVLTGTNGVTGEVTSVTGSGGSYVVTVAGIRGSGSLSLGLAPGSDIADLAGNLATLVPAARAVTGVAPVLPVITAYSVDSGVQGDGITSDPTPTLSGIGLAGATVTVAYATTAGSQTATTTVAGDGTWSVEIPTLTDGAYSFTASLTANGNPIGTSQPLALTIDTTADGGTAATLTVAATADGIIRASEAVAVTFTVAGLDAGTSGIVTFTDGAGALDVPVTADGAYVVDLSALNGTVTSTLALSDAAGNTAAIVGNPVPVFTARPGAPTIGGISDDTGIRGDGITSDQTPTVTGTAELGSLVHVTYTGATGPQVLDVPVGLDGRWTAQLPTLTDGAYTLTATATGPGGIESLASAPVTVTIDTVLDAAPAATLTAAANTGPFDATEARGVGLTVAGLDPGTTGTALFFDGFTTVSVPVTGNGPILADLSSLNGAVTATLALNDAAGNFGTVQTGLALVVDTVAPLGSAVADVAGGTTVASFTYAVTFPEAVANVTANDFVLTGTNGATGQITSVTGSGGSYVVTVAGVQGSGILSLGLAPGSDIADLAGNLATLTPATRDVVGVAPVLPVITAYSVDSGVPGDGITSDPTPTLSGIGLAGATITVAYATAAGAQSATATVAGDGTWSVEIPTLSDGAYSFTASLTANGNLVTSQPLALTIDTTADGGTAATLTVDPTGDQRINATEAGTVAYTVAGLDPGAVGRVTFTDASHGMTVMDVGNGTYSADLSGFSGPVTSVLTIQDAAGNTATRAGTLVTVDTVAPTGTATPSPQGGSGATTFTYAVAFSETVVNVTADDFVLTGTGGASGRVDSVTAAGTGYLVTVTDVAGTGSLALGLAATADIADAFGNRATLSATPRAVDVGGAPQPAPTLITGFGDDTGVQGDRITSDRTPELSGTAAAGGTVTVAYAEAGILKSVSAPVDATGAWTVEIPALPDGSYSFTASAVTAGGAPSGTSGPLALTVDTVADAVPLVSLTVGGQAGGTLTPAQAAAVTFVVAGLDAGSAAAVTFSDGTRTVRVEAGADGTYQADLSGLTGPVTSAFVVSDAAGNSAVGTGNGVVIGQTGTSPGDPPPTGGPAPGQDAPPLAAPDGAPVVTGLQPDTGIPGDGVTSDPSPTLTGTGTPGGSVTVSYGNASGSQSVTAPVGSDGAWAVKLPTLPDGAYDVVATGRDAAGTATPAGQPFRVVVDTLADGGTPVALAVEPTGDGVINAAEAVDTAYRVTGVDAGSRATVTFTDGTHTVTTQVAGDGRYTVDLTGLNGPVTSTILATDAAGNGAQAAGNTVTLDTVGPATGANLAPNAVHDAIATATHAAAVTGNVLANDSDPNAGDVLHVTAVRFSGGITVDVPREGTVTVLGDHGTLHLAADGRYSYQAIGSSNLSTDAHVAELFTYTVSDGKGLSAQAGLAVSLDGAAPAAEASFGFAFTEARVERLGETLVLTGPDGVPHDIGGIGSLHFADGSIQQDDGHALVDDVWYLAHNLDVWKAGVDADTHYETYGWHEGRDPNAYFSTQTYLAANPDVASAGVNPLEHYAQYGEHEGRSPSPDFSGEAYLAQYSDVAASGENALEHYLHYGLGEGRNVQDGKGNAGHIGAFDPAFYLAENPDVAAVAAEARPFTLSAPDYAFHHYVTYGADEGRAPNALFDPDFYLSANPDVAASGLNPLLHYEEYGWREGRDPGPGFDTNAYLEHNPDIAAADIDPLQHFLDFGMKEGRLPV